LALEFEWDSRKAASNLAKHGVSFDEAATVFGDPLGRIVADSRHSAEEERFVLLGNSQRSHLLAVMFVDRGKAIRIIVRARQPAVSVKTMKRERSKGDIKKRVAADEILPEYDFANGTSNKYASRYAAGSSVIVLDPDVAGVPDLRRG
jgi:uncharacterized protein